MFSDEQRSALSKVLLEGAEHVGVHLSQDEAAKLLTYLALLLEWNQKVNLTAITDPLAAVEHHLVDALAVSSSVADLSSVLDVGTGGGLPGIPLAILRPHQSWVLVDTLKKKVGFLKSAAAALGLKNVRAIQGRAAGQPEREKIPVCDGAISRAFTSAPEWFQLAKHYVSGPRAVLFMLGVGTDGASLAAQFSDQTNALTVVDYTLPTSGIGRQVVRMDLKAP